MTVDTPDTDPAAAPPRRRPKLRGLFWAVVIALLVLVQWPMLKGAYYRVSGAAPPPDNIAWRTDYSGALAEARESGKPVMIDFTADWCPPCQVMKHDVWPDESVRQAIETNAIPLLIDVDQPANQAVQARYEVSTIPTILLVDGEGRVLKTGSFMSRRAILDFLNGR